MNNKVVIIGCGNVGMSYAYSLLNQKTSVHELVLIDLNQDRIIGEAMDLNHCLAFAPNKINIKAGTYSDCKNASIIVIAAGANQAPGETRMDLINKNSKIFKDIIDKVMDTGFNGIFLVATNPLDVMTYLTYKYSGLPANRIIGSGTCLDTARLKFLVSEKVGISPKDINAYVVGEHGDSEFILWKESNISLQSIDKFISKDEQKKIEDDVRNAAYEIIAKKGATYYGIGMSLTRITNAILGDENTVLTVSNYDAKNDVFVGMPAIIGRNGIEDKVYIEIDKEEEVKLENSIRVIKEAINKVED